MTEPIKKPAPRWRRWAVAVGIGLAVGWFIDPFISAPDTAAYFSWGWSAATDADFSFTNEFSTFRFPRYFVWVTPTGYVANDWPIGSGMAWLPVMVPAAWGEGLLGVSGPEGASRFMREWAPGPLSIALLLAWTTLLTLFVLRWALQETRSWFGATSARVGAWVTVLGTPFLFYLLFGPFFSHTVSFAAVGLFLLLWLRWRGEWTTGRALALGIAAGWMTCVRPQAVLFTLVVPIEEAARWWQARRSERPKTDGEWAVMAPSGWPMVAWMTLGAVVGFVPQMIAWWRLYGSPVALPKLEEMHWFSPAIGKVLFSDFHGVLTYTPAVALALIGLWALARRLGPAGLALAIAFLLQLYVNAANEVWWGGGSFGNRRLVDASVIVLWALAALWSEARNRTATDKAGRIDRAQWILAVLGAICCAWTLWLILAERATLLTLDHYVPFDETFRANLGKVWTEPERLGKWIASTRGLGAGFRLVIAALVASGWVGMDGWLVRLRRSTSEDESATQEATSNRPRRWVGFVVAAAALDLSVVIFALRTPPFSPSWLHDIELPRENQLLATNYIELGHYWLQHQRPEKALPLFRKADGLRGGDLVTRRWIATALTMNGDFREAAPIFEALLQRYPDDGPTLREARRLLVLWANAEPESPDPWNWANRWREFLKPSTESPAPAGPIGIP